jgi:large subunit ribosomal protein L29
MGRGLGAALAKRRREETRGCAAAWSRWRNEKQTDEIQTGEIQAMVKASELREMSDEQLLLHAKEAAEQLFRLRVKAQTSRLETPSELRKNRRLIARVKTLLTERAKLTEPAKTPASK